LYFSVYQHYKDLGIILVDRASILSCMKIVVLGRADKALNTVENNAGDTYYYVGDVDEAIESVARNYADMLVIEDDANIENPLNEIMMEFNSLPQEVRIIFLSPSSHYFIVVNNTMNSSIHYFIDEKKPLKRKRKSNYYRIE